MPIYEYTCQDCATRFEQFVRSLASGNEVKCPNCGGAHVKKEWSLFGVSTATAGLGRSSAVAGSCSPTGT